MRKIRIQFSVERAIHAAKLTHLAKRDVPCAPNHKWKKTQTGLDFWDTLATMTALHPQIVTQEFKNVPIKIVIQKGNDYAATWVTSHSKNDVIVDDHINSKAFYRLLLAGM